MWLCWERCVGDSSATHQCWAFWKYITTYHIPLEKENNLPTLPKRASKIPKNIQQMLNLSGKGLLNLAPESLTHWPLRILKTWCWEYLGHLFESDIPKTGTPIFMRCSPFCVHTSSMASWSSRWTPPAPQRRHAASANTSGSKMAPEVEVEALIWSVDKATSFLWLYGGWQKFLSDFGMIGPLALRLAHSLGLFPHMVCLALALAPSCAALHFWCLFVML